ncbi:hypothetical protein BSL78_05728 [Apostichopus japonicus]|uniref:Uncharacterized protein n=1 Tax=Stichopus japonicus TaxID=307972 RepID=A0A2G8LAQ2_STIJA|nr:hypothetical protein BSL78_05728 [Apostichopus japonicus]
MASEDADREMENSNSESEHDSDEDLAVLELIDASSSDDDDEEDDKEDVVRRQPDRRNRAVPESDRATSSSSSRVDRPLSALVEEDVKVKRYPNKTGTFVTGIDVLSKEAREKRSKRADRFGLSKQERKSSPDGGIEDIAGVTLAPGSKIGI